MIFSSGVAEQMLAVRAHTPDRHCPAYDDCYMHQLG